MADMENIKFQEFETWYYMDEHPFTDVLMCTAEQAKAQEKHMKENWCSGTYRYVKEYTREEARNFILKTVGENITEWKKDKSYADDVLNEIIRMAHNFEKCYPEE